MSEVENNRGTYIALEGGNKSGKSVQSRLLMEDLEKKYPNRQIGWTREPGGISEISTAIREMVQATPFNEAMDPVCEAYLYAAARAQSIRREVAPIIKTGGIVVSDRSIFSSLAFQGWGRDLGWKRVWAINEEAVGQYLPDKVIVLEVPEVLAKTRPVDVKGDKFELLGSDFYQKVALGYRELVKIFPGVVEVIDGTGTVEQVRNRIAQALLGVV